MAVLNIADKFNDTYLSRSPKELIFTKDKHIVTHGVDLLSDYNKTDGERGLVPNYPGGNRIFGKTGWELLTTDLTNIQAEDGTVPSSYAVINYLNNIYKDAILAAETMVFKGTIKYDNTDGNFKYTLVGKSEQTGFIPSGNIGDTYRITTHGTIAGTTVEPGDILICIQNHNSTQNSSSYWTIIQTNITGSRNLIAGGTTYKFYSNDTTDVTIYSPSRAGTNGQFLQSSGGNTPNWVNLNISKNSNGVLQLTTSSNPTSVNISDWTQNLTFGTGLSGTANGIATSIYNGTIATTINLAKATTSTLGGIKIDDGTTNHNNPQVAIPTISIDSNGMIYLTQQNIVNALGYLPTDPSGLVTYSAGQGINLDNQTISLLKATNTSLGGIIASNVLSTAVSLTSSNGSTAGRYYGVQIDKDGKAFVNVPWTDSNNTWRNITIGGESIGNQTLNFITVANGSIGIVANVNDQNTTNSDIFDIGFDIFWYNLDTNTYETN